MNIISSIYMAQESENSIKFWSAISFKLRFFYDSSRSLLLHSLCGFSEIFFNICKAGLIIHVFMYKYNSKNFMQSIFSNSTFRYIQAFLLIFAKNLSIFTFMMLNIFLHVYKLYFIVPFSYSTFQLLQNEGSLDYVSQKLKKIFFRLLLENDVH